MKLSKSEKVALIISTRNRKSDLMETIEKSVLAGIDTSSIYIADDASEDGTFDEIRRRFASINIFRNDKPKGYIHNRNFLMRLVPHEYTLSLDDDSNLLDPSDLVEAIQIMDEDKKCAVFSFTVVEQIEMPPAKNHLPDRIKKVKTFIGCGHIIRKSVLKEIGYYREELEFYCEELDFSLRAYNAGYHVLNKENLVVHHRIDWKERNRQVESETRKGIYGAVYRSKLGFSNSLTVRALNYPYLLDIAAIMVYTFKRCFNYLILKRDMKGFFGGGIRFLKFVPYIVANRNKLSYKKFLVWNSLPVS
ncbi:MAG: glycosyltransferase family 2 protein [Cytophagaceae bacterium]